MKKLSDFKLYFEDLPFQVNSRVQPVWAKEKKWLKWIFEAAKNDAKLIIKSGKKQFRGFTKKARKWYRNHKPKHLKITIDLTWTRIILIMVFAWAIWPHSDKTIAVNQPQEGATPVKIVHVEQLKKLPTPKFKPIAELAPIPVAPVAIQNKSSGSQNGCVTYWSGDYYLDKIINFESTGNSCATNPGGCFGLLQACPGAPLRLACGGDPVCQIQWFIDNKTGGRSWAQIWQHELDYGWW